MKHLFARIGKSEYARVFAGTEIPTELAEKFAVPTLDPLQLKSFDPEVQLAGDEWFFVDLSPEQTKAMVNPYIEVARSTADINLVSGSDYGRTDCLFLVDQPEQGGSQVLFHRVRRSSVVSARKFLCFDSGVPQYQSVTNTIEFDATVHGYWDGLSRLYFRNYHDISPLVKGFEQVYREATEAELDGFLESPLFSVQSGFRKEKAGQRNLRHVASLAETMPRLEDPATRRAFLAYARQYPGLSLAFEEDGRIRISKPTDLTSAINVLLERLYTAPISHEMRMAGSTTVLAGRP